MLEIEVITSDLKFTHPSNPASVNSSIFAGAPANNNTLEVLIALKVLIKSTNIATLSIIKLEDLQAYSVN